jgi:hypothetical protein
MIVNSLLQPVIMAEQPGDNKSKTNVELDDERILIEEEKSAEGSSLLASIPEGRSVIHTVS